MDGLDFRLKNNSTYVCRMSEFANLVQDLSKQVWSELGPGYSERVYHNAMEVMLRNSGVKYETERIIPIPFKGHIIGNLRADIVVNDELILELKAIRTIKSENAVQAENYIRLTGIPHAIVVNFPQSGGTEVEFLTKETHLPSNKKCHDTQDDG